MNKSLLVKGLTINSTTAAGVAADDVLDITEKVYGPKSPLLAPISTEQYYSTLLDEVIKEGAYKFEMERKGQIHMNATTAALHNGTGKIGATLGAVSTANFDTLKGDIIKGTLDGSWEIAVAIDKKLDPIRKETKLLSAITTRMDNLRKTKAKGFWQAIAADIDTTTGKTKSFPVYPKASTGEKVAYWPAWSEIDISSGTPEVKAAKIVDQMFMDVVEVENQGLTGSATEEYPYADGVEVVKEFVVKRKFIPTISMDPRFIATNSAEEIMRTGVLGVINKIAIKTEKMFDNCVGDDIDYALILTGEYGAAKPIMEASAGLETVPHPTKPSRATLTEGSGAYDVVVFPYINLSRFRKLKTV